MQILKLYSLSMSQEIIRNQDVKVANWSGGTTSELFIYPKIADFKKLNFSFRLSRATIEVEESNFTALPKVKRKLMLLDGELELIHEGEHSKSLKPFEFDVFSGDWNTKSIGKVTDFNLMMLGNTKGDFDVIKSENKQSYTYKITKNFTIFYIADGILDFNETALVKGDLLIFENEEKYFEFNLAKASNVVVVKINL